MDEPNFWRHISFTVSIRSGEYIELHWQAMVQRQIYIKYLDLNGWRQEILNYVQTDICCDRKVNIYNLDLF